MIGRERLGDYRIRVSLLCGEAPGSSEPTRCFGGSERSDRTFRETEGERGMSGLGAGGEKRSEGESSVETPLW